MKLIIIITLFSFISSPAFCSEIRAVSDIWPPYIINMEKGQGYLVEILTEVFQRENLKLKLKTETFSKAKKMVSVGNSDILVGCTNDDGNSGARAIEIPLAKLRYAFFTKKNEKRWKYTGIASLRKRNLGVIKGYGYGPVDSYINSTKSNVKIYEPNAPLVKLIRDLKKGTIDVFAQDINVTAYTLKNNFPKLKLNNSGFLGEKNSIYLCVSENSKHADFIHETITRSLEQMTADGTIAKLKVKYSINL